MPVSLLTAAVLWTSAAEAKKNTLPAGAEVVTEKAPWETKSGIESTKLEMIEALIQADNPNEALSMVANMRNAGSDEIELDVLQSRALRKLGMFDDADQILQSAVHKHPRQASAHHELGLLFLDRRDIEDALPELQMAAKEAPDNADFLNNYGFALISAGHPDEAVEPLRASLKLDSSRDKTRNNLGFALVATGKEKEAYRLFRSSQTEADAHYNVGYGLELKGKRDEALEEYHSALSSNPHHVVTLKAIERLQRTANPNAPALPGAFNAPGTSPSPVPVENP